VEWIGLDEDMNQWWDLAHTVMHFGFLKMRGISGRAKEPLSFQGLRCMELVSLFVRQLVG